MMYKTFNKYGQVSSQFSFGNFNKKFISNTVKNISDFWFSFFSSKPYLYEKYSLNKNRDTFKNTTDLYLIESRRTFL